jgi:hypothetical protein
MSLIVCRLDGQQVFHGRTLTETGFSRVAVPIHDLQQVIEKAYRGRRMVDSNARQQRKWL